MQIDKYINRLLQLDALIRLKATGTPKRLAEKLGISERMTYEYILEMKRLGAPIKYSAPRRSYTYTEDVTFEIGYKKTQSTPVLQKYDRPF